MFCSRLQHLATGSENKLRIESQLLLKIFNQCCYSTNEKKRKSLEKPFTEEKIVNSGLCITEAIKGWAKQLLTDSSSRQREWSPAVEAARGQLCNRLPFGRKTHLCIPATCTLLRGCLTLVAILWFVIQRVGVGARRREQACFSGTSFVCLLVRLCLKRDLIYQTNMFEAEWDKGYAAL